MEYPLKNKQLSEGFRCNYVRSTPPGIDIGKFVRAFGSPHPGAAKVFLMARIDGDGLEVFLNGDLGRGGYVAAN